MTTHDPTPRAWRPRSRLEGILPRVGLRRPSVPVEGRSAVRSPGAISIDALRVRVGQVGYALTARWAGPNDTLVSPLSPAERRLFDTLPRTDRAHALRVATRVQSAGHTHPALLKAALLHDSGKAGQGIRLWHRIVWVLARKWGQRPQDWLAAGAHGWRRPFYALAHHATLGAGRLAARGSDPLTVALVRYHDCPTLPPEHALDNPLLHALQYADDRG
jgi:hypothetical protein